MRLRPRQLLKLFLALCILYVVVPVLLESLLDWMASYEAYRLDIPATNTGPEGSSSQEQRLAAVCADTVCGEKFLLKFSQQQQQPPIPAIRHILWKSEFVSNYFLQQLKSWQRVHPDWTFVLWRDSDLEPFVREHFPGKIYRKFASLPTTGMRSIDRIDMFRYMLLYKFGGVYADLDYTLVSSLDTYRRYPAVVTREPEAHAVQHFGLVQWPLSIMANAALLMSAPGHPFFGYALHQLVESEDFAILQFAGPLGLSKMLNSYYQMHLAMVHPAEFVYIPPSFSFYPYTGNRLDSGTSYYMKARVRILKGKCRQASNSRVLQVQQFCKDVFNLDPITDNNQPLVAIHDMQKKRAAYDDASIMEFVSDMQSAVKHINNLKLGNEFATQGIDFK